MPLIVEEEIEIMPVVEIENKTINQCRSYNDNDFGIEIAMNSCGPLNSSISTSNITSTEPDPFYFYEVEQFTFLGILLFVIVVGNLAVLGAIMLAKTQRKSRMNFFITHLALADMSVGLINVLTDIIWKLTVTWYLGNVACKLVKYFQTVVIYSSNYVLVALSIDRYDAITHPLKFSGSWRRARILIAMAWGLSFLFSTPALFIFGETQSVPGGVDVTQCWADLELYQWKIYITVVFIILFLIPAIIIAVCYTVMVHTIWTQPRLLNMNVKKSTSNGVLRKLCRGKSTVVLYEDDSRRASSRGLIPKAKIKSVKMTFVIVFVFILCSSPYFVFSLFQVYGFMPKTKAVYAIATFFQSLSPLNSAANPIIYCLFSTHICRNFRKIKAIDWIAEKLCPMFGGGSPRESVQRRKYLYTNNNQGRTRTEFTSMTASLRKSTRFGPSTLHRQFQVQSTCVYNKELQSSWKIGVTLFRPRLYNLPGLVLGSRSHCSGGSSSSDTDSRRNFKQEMVDLHS